MNIVILSEQQIKNNWDNISTDTYNNRPDIKSPEKYISEAKKGNVTAGGATVVIQSKLTTCKT